MATISLELLQERIKELEEEVDTRRDVLANISQHDCVLRAEGIGA